MDKKSFFAYVRNKSNCKVQVGPVMDAKVDHLVTENDMVTAFNFVSVEFTSEDTSYKSTPVNNKLKLQFI